MSDKMSDVKSYTKQFEDNTYIHTYKTVLPNGKRWEVSVNSPNKELTSKEMKIVMKELKKYV